MKKWTVALLTLSLLAAGAAFAEGPNPFDETLTYTLADNVLTVELAANATTGYAWQYDMIDEGLLEETRNEYVPDQTAQDMVGVGGRQIYSFAPTTDAAGQIVGLSFSYLQVGQSEPEKLYQILVDVDLDGNMLVNSVMDVNARLKGLKYDTDGKALRVELDSNPTTGYTWSYRASPEGLLTEQSNEYTPQPVEEGVVGSGGVQLYVFVPAAGAHGSVELTFLEGRSWEEGAVRRFQLYIDINDNGEVSVAHAWQVPDHLPLIGDKYPCPTCNNPDAVVIDMYDGGDMEATAWFLTLDCPTCGKVEEIL